MCGRYASTRATADLAEEFRAVDATGPSSREPDYNVAPTKQVVAVVARHPRDADGDPDPHRTERTLRMLRWGLVPSWAKDERAGTRMINARSETAGEKPAFRRALAARRCLLPADGWYEWQRVPREGSAPHKQPYYTCPTDGSSLALAGLWEYWKPNDDPEGRFADGLVTACVLTTDAVGPLARVHDRMPLLLPRSAWEAWLDPDRRADDDAVAAALTPPSSDLVAGLTTRAVSPLVNNVGNNGPELLEPLTSGDVTEPLQLDLLAGPNPA